MEQLILATAHSQGIRKTPVVMTFFKEEVDCILCFHIIVVQEMSMLKIGAQQHPRRQ